MEEPPRGPSWLEKAAPSRGNNKQVLLVAVDCTEMSVVGFLMEQKEAEEETRQCYCITVLCLKAERALMNLS